MSKTSFHFFEQQTINSWPVLIINGYGHSGQVEGTPPGSRPNGPRSPMANRLQGLAALRLNIITCLYM